MNRWLRSLSYTCCVLLLLFVPACSDDSDPTNPGGGGGGGGGVTGDPVLDAGIAQGLAISDALLGLMPQWASGDLVGPPTKDAAWNPNCQCWTWEVAEGDPTANPFDYTTWFFEAQFFNGETVVQNPQEADRVQVTINYLWTKGFYDLEENKKDDESTTFSSTITLNIQPLGGDPVEVSGGGTAEFISVGTINGQFFEYFGQFLVDINMTVPLSGCPTGMIVIDQDTNLFSISFDGTTTAWWSFAPAQGEIIRGSRTVICSD